MTIAWTHIFPFSERLQGASDRERRDVRLGQPHHDTSIFKYNDNTIMKYLAAYIND